jgi:hypothetical protein
LWILAGVAASMFRTLPYSFATPLLGMFYVATWVVAGVVIALTAAFGRFKNRPSPRTRAAIFASVIATMLLLFVGSGAVAGAGERLWFSMHEREWTQAAEAAVQSGGANLPAGWEYSQGQGDTWVGVHYGDGLLDNWVGYVYSASGKSPEGLPKALFDDQITSCSRLASRWFICGFT